MVDNKSQVVDVDKVDNKDNILSTLVDRIVDKADGQVLVHMVDKTDSQILVDAQSGMTKSELSRLQIRL